MIEIDLSECWYGGLGQVLFYVFLKEKFLVVWFYCWEGENLKMCIDCSYWLDNMIIYYGIFNVEMCFFLVSDVFDKKGECRMFQ